ncbi:hypothetical protein EV182_007917, partial [Spiromyces aspiralis]
MVDNTLYQPAYHNRSRFHQSHLKVQPGPDPDGRSVPRSSNLDPALMSVSFSSLPQSHTPHYRHHHFQKEEPLCSYKAMSVPGDQLQEFSQQFWEAQHREIQEGEHDFRSNLLPLARIKKVMKSDPDVKVQMISAEAPVLFSKACEIFITELTQRAWLNAEENKRRTLQRQDVSAATTKSEMFDFLIDVVPREDISSKRP